MSSGASLQDLNREVTLKPLSARDDLLHPLVLNSGRVKSKPVNGQLDLALVWEADDCQRFSPHFANVPMKWITPVGMNASLALHKGLLAVATFDRPRYPRETGAAALDKAGIACRCAFSRLNLSALWAAVSSGLGVTVRTEIGIPTVVQALNSYESRFSALPLRRRLKLDGVLTAPDCEMAPVQPMYASV